MLSGVAAESYFADAVNVEADSEAKLLWKTSLENNKEAIIHSTSLYETTILKNKKNIIFADSFTANLWSNFPCKIATSPTRYNEHFIALPFKKNSSFLNVFNFCLNQMGERGMLSQTHNHIIKLKPYNSCDEKRDWSIGYQNIFSAFIFSGIGCFLAVWTWTMEYLYFHVLIRKLNDKKTCG